MPKQSQAEEKDRSEMKKEKQLLGPHKYSMLSTQCYVAQAVLSSSFKGHLIGEDLKKN